MKIIIQLLCFFLLHAQQALSNNVQVSNVRLTGQDTINNFTMVEFDISWENSWRYSGGPANWDATWVFVKYKVGSGGEWKHAWLNNTGHLACGNANISNGFLSPELPYHSSTNPSLGVFIYRSSSGSGTFSCQDIQLRWNYGTNSVVDAAQVDIRVFAIEMVYIPQGGFYVGSGGTESGAFYKYPNSINPYFISGEGAITIGTSTDLLYYNNPSGESGDQIGPVPAPYPKGFNAFYAMKHEISQQAYTDFLNSLTRTQQMARVSTDISNTSVDNEWVMTNSTEILNRSYIKCRAIIPAQPTPVTFMVDQNMNDIPGDAGDGQYVACNWLSYPDVSAYMDWAGLRLMSEFEFEKCGRGIELPYANEFAWGNLLIIRSNTSTNLHLVNELSTDPMANYPGAVQLGPSRIGMFARNNSDRITAGAGYYGILDLSGSLWEIGVNIGSPAGRAYTGKHGDGKLSTSGQHDVIAWPEASLSSGFCFRGGSIGATDPRARLSDRESAAHPNPVRNFSFGGRGVRTAQ